MILLLMMLVSAQDAPATAGPVINAYGDCLAIAARDAVAGEREAALWKAAGGGAAAEQCAGVSLAGQERWGPAASAFEDAARLATTQNDARAAGAWAQAGNAWLAASDFAHARTALDAAVNAGTLAGLDLGEARLDRARALVALGELPAARTELDAALALAGDDGLAWLLSATLARRMNDLPRARTDIAEALRRAPDAAETQLEAGNIAAAGGDADAAKTAWQAAVRDGAESTAGKNAAVALAQFGG